MASLADFEDKAETAPPTRPGGKSDLDQLPDGKYKFAVTGMCEKHVRMMREDERLLVEIGIECITDGPFFGKKFDHTYWLNKKDKDSGEMVKDDMAFDRLRRDLITFGFDVPNWKTSNGRPFIGEFAKACAVIAGVEFFGKKVTKDGYAQLYVNERAAGDGRPEKFGPDELKAAKAPFSVDD